MLIEFVLRSEEDLLYYGIQIESFSFEVTKELKKLFSYASRFRNFMYLYYDFEIPINTKEAFNFTTIFYSRKYSFKPKKNPSEFSFIKELEKEFISQPRLSASFRFDVYAKEPSLDQSYIKEIASLAKICKENDKVELIVCDLPFEVEYKVYYI